MREFLAQKGGLKRTTFDLVDWEAVDKMMDNSLQQFCFWVAKRVSKCSGTERMLHRWGEATDALCTYCMTTGFQEDTCHQLHCLDKDKGEFFDDDVQKFAKKLAYLETHPNLRRSLLKFVRGKG